MIKREKGEREKKRERKVKIERKEKKKKEKRKKKKKKKKRKGGERKEPGLTLSVTDLLDQSLLLFPTERGEKKRRGPSVL